MTQYDELLDFIWTHWHVGEVLTRRELRSRFDPEFAERHPQQQSPDKTIDRLLQVARDRGVLAFDMPGEYRLLTPRQADVASATQVAWFVGATFGDRGDQSARFLRDGIWENGYEDRLLDQVRSMQPGDLIAIKSAYTRKHGLPFDNRGNTVSVMAIKAVGVITSNDDDGKRVRVDWKSVDPVREWYFYTNRGTIWRLPDDDWRAEGLRAFAFLGADQDIDRFRNSPYWQERFGDAPSDSRFGWTPFYEAVASALLDHRHDRTRLVEGLRAIGEDTTALDYLHDKFSDGTTGFARDICPFTTMGIFNRGTTVKNRRAIAGRLAELLGVDEPVPHSFDGIPVLNNQNSWFYGWERDRGDDDIEALWNLFAAALQLADGEDENAAHEFVAAYDDALRRKGAAWNLTFAMYWVRPWSFLSLDRNSREYVQEVLGFTIARRGAGRRISGADYLELMSSLEARFAEPNSPVASFPDVSYAAWHRDPTEHTEEDDDEVDLDDRPAAPPYTLDDVLAEGCFVPQARLEQIIKRLRQKRNVVLQGPPGTGKTWLARRLGYVLAGQRSDHLVNAVQFHPNLSYEDFVRGWRPSGNGQLSLVDGPFLRSVTAAAENPAEVHVVVVEEINRGNPAQIFGEMLTLLEHDKRTPNDALELCYPRYAGERVYLPENLYLIGTMNVADRSLTLVDLALRRRFAFVDLEPALNDTWRSWVIERCGLTEADAADIAARIGDLNQTIAGDPSLGPQFQVGHSYATPPTGKLGDEGRMWFRDVVDTEIRPLLEEYWFDAPDKAREAHERLLAGL